MVGNLTFIKKYQHRINIPLRWALVVPFVLQTVAAVGLTGWISLRNGQRAVNDLANQLQTEVGNRIADHLDTYLLIPAQINQVNLRSVDLGLLDLTDLDAVGRSFLQQLQIFKVSYINYGSEANEFIGATWAEDGGLQIVESLKPSEHYTFTYRVNEAGDRLQIEEREYTPDHVREEEWYANAAEAGHPIWSEIYQWPGAPILSISSSYPVYDDRQQFIGVLGVDLTLSQVSDFLCHLSLSTGSRLFIMERDGQLVATNSKQPFQVVNQQAHRLHAIDSTDPLIQTTARSLLSQFDSLTDIQTNQQITIRWNDEKQYVQVMPWQDEMGLDWLIVVVVPESDFMAAINANTRTTILLCAATLSIAVLLSLVTSRLLVRPMLRVIQAADALAQENWQPLLLPESRTQELAQLARAFNRMASQLQTSFARLEHNAYHDALTGLLNQLAFRRKLQAAIDRQMAESTEAVDASPRTYFAVLFLDLDYFKLVNDSLGHLAGDRLLQQVTARLQACVRSHQDTIARFGGDEFVILLETIRQTEDATQIAGRILQELTRSFLIQDVEVFISASIGIVLSTIEGTEADTFLRNADIALYRAKANGKASFEVFNAAMHTAAVDRFQLESDLRRAIERQELEIYYQPIVNSTTTNILGFEALLRWHHPSQGMVSPAEFIPVAEESGLIVKLGWWVLEQACWQMQDWRQRFPTCQSMQISINLSSKQFFQPNLLQQIETILTLTQLPPHLLKLEITESIFMNHGEATRAKLTYLQGLNVQLSIDDFGTGYSSLGYLHRFPINTLKIDRSFIQQLGTNGENLAIVEAITVMAYKLGMDVIAEGVETIEQLRQLRRIGCDQVQGFLFSPPLKASRIEELLIQPQAAQVLPDLS